MGDMRVCFTGTGVGVRWPDGGIVRGKRGNGLLCREGRVYNREGGLGGDWDRFASCAVYGVHWKIFKHFISSHSET